MATASLLGLIDLNADRTAPGTARQYVRGLLGGIVHEDLELVTSELVTNAVLHADRAAGGQITVVLLEIDDLLRVEVIDEGGSCRPRVIDDPDASSGRGLLLVDQVSVRWNTWQDSAGRTTGAEVPRDPAQSRCLTTASRQADDG